MDMWLANRNKIKGFEIILPQSWTLNVFNTILYICKAVLKLSEQIFDNHIFDLVTSRLSLSVEVGSVEKLKL